MKTKKLMIKLALIVFILTCLGCSSQLYLIDKSTGKEYVLLKELPLKPIDRLILHWRTTYDSPYIQLDSKSGKFFYLKGYDYSKVIHSSTDTLQNRFNLYAKEWKWLKRLTLFTIGCSIGFIIIMWLHLHNNKGNDNNEDDSYPL